MSESDTSKLSALADQSASATTKQDNASSTSEEKPSITIKVVSQNGQETHFKVRTTTPLQKVFDSYCVRQSLDEKSIRFLFDGNRISGDKTAEQLQLEDGDTIDVAL